MMLLERVGEEEQAILEADGPGVGHSLHEEMPGILYGRKALRIFAPRVYVL
jgi:hypothetical protein